MLIALILAGCAAVEVKFKRLKSQLPENVKKIALNDESGRAAALLAILHSSGNETAKSVATQELVTILYGRHFAPLDLPLGSVASKLAMASANADTINPTVADELIPAAALEINGLLSRSLQDGIGVPYVAHFKAGSPQLAGQPGFPRVGMSIPVTALIAFDKNGAELSFYQTLRKDHVRIAGHTYQLATDFSASLAHLISKGRNRLIDFQALIYSDKNISQAGLIQLQAYDPTKIPVVFVHGLLSRPEAWMQAANELVADPKIRSRYQFWFFMYPTGLPVWESAAKLRSELDRFRQTLDPHHTNPKLNQIVLVGHSMGGLICDLMVRDGGQNLWSQFSDTPYKNIPISTPARKRMESMIEFNARKDVSRVIFVSTPHRGSDIALNPLADLFSNLIRLPLEQFRGQYSPVIMAMRSNVRDLFGAPVNSIRFLKSKSPLLLSILNLPPTPGLPFHSVIGDRGKGGGVNSSDGVVPYWSSHLDFAVSEKIVPSGHGANENLQGIAEIHRILLEAANIKPTGLTQTK
jgi:triacylglycerol esterase/lipase EstA (alpha/beta hydrolase family)